MESVKDCAQFPVDITGRYAHKIVYAVQSLKSNVFISHNGRTVNAKSILGILSLQLKEKNIVDIYCYGDDAAQLEGDMKFIVNFISDLENK